MNEIKPPEVSIVIAVHNEEANVLPLLDEMAAVLADWDRRYEIVLIDDGSTDATRDRMREGRARHEVVRNFALSRQQGKSAALGAGFRAARGRLLVTFDGDMQNDPRDIPGVVAQAGPGVLVCGARRERMDRASKRIGSRWANAIRRRFLDDDATDTGCGVKVFPAESRSLIPWIEGVHRFFPSILKRCGYRIVNVPITDRPRERGVTKYTNLGRLIVTSQDLFGFWWYLRRHVDTRAEEL